MIYQQQETITELKSLVKSFWLIDSENDNEIRKQKIIPDGYPELIFHYRDKYQANISGSWFLQEKNLFAGQIRNHFYLKNTGYSGMFGIKLQPWAPKLLFNFNMNEFTDRVVEIKSGKSTILAQMIKLNDTTNLTFKDRVEAIEQMLLNFDISLSENIKKGKQAVELIIAAKGEITIAEIVEKVDLSERSLERFFKSHIGVSPKFYSRIIRFAAIFDFIQKDNFDWSDITFLAGFYDQSHFIKNFKEFTGEEPSKYGFEEKNIANFFLKK